MRGHRRGGVQAPLPRGACRFSRGWCLPYRRRFVVHADPAGLSGFQVLGIRLLRGACRGRQSEGGKRGRYTELRTTVVRFPNPVGGDQRRWAQALAGTRIRSKPADEAAQRYERVLDSLQFATRGGHLEQGVFQPAHCLSRAGGRCLLVANQLSGPAEPVTCLQIRNEVPARSVRRIESSERGRLVWHLAVGLDDGIPLKASDSSCGADASNRTRRVQPRSSRAFPDSKASFCEDGCRFGECGWLGPDGGPDLAARSVRVLRRQAACSRAGGFERERKGRTAAACCSPTPRESAGERQRALHRQHHVPCVQRVVTLVSGRPVGPALPGAELAHRTMLFGAPDNVEQRRFELGAALFRRRVQNVQEGVASGMARAT